MSAETLGMTLAFMVIGTILIGAFIWSIGIVRQERKNQDDKNENRQNAKDK